MGTISGQMILDWKVPRRRFLMCVSKQFRNGREAMFMKFDILDLFPLLISPGTEYFVFSNSSLYLLNHIMIELFKASSEI